LIPPKNVVEQTVMGVFEKFTYTPAFPAGAEPPISP
jgi:hypothetical protein